MIPVRIQPLLWILDEKFQIYLSYLILTRIVLKVVEKPKTFLRPILKNVYSRQLKSAACIGGRLAPFSLANKHGQGYGLKMLAVNHSQETVSIVIDESVVHKTRNFSPVNGRFPQGSALTTRSGCFYLPLLRQPWPKHYTWMVLELQVRYWSILDHDSAWQHPFTQSCSHWG